MAFDNTKFPIKVCLANPQRYVARERWWPPNMTIFVYYYQPVAYIVAHTSWHKLAQLLGIFSAKNKLSM